MRNLFIPRNSAYHRTLMWIFFGGGENLWVCNIFLDIHNQNIISSQRKKMRLERIYFHRVHTAVFIAGSILKNHADFSPGLATWLTMLGITNYCIYIEKTDRPVGHTTTDYSKRIFSFFSESAPCD